MKSFSWRSQGLNLHVDARDLSHGPSQGHASTYCDEGKLYLSEPNYTLVPPPPQHTHLFTLVFPCSLQPQSSCRELPLKKESPNGRRIVVQGGKAVFSHEQCTREGELIHQFCCSTCTDISCKMATLVK